MSTSGRPPADYGPIQLAEHARLPRWVIARARAEDLVPDPDVDGHRWSGAIADDVARRAADITTAIGTEHPLGANRAAERIAERTGLDVAGDDVREATEHGHLHAVDEYKGHALYDCRDLDELDPDVLEPVIAERLAWIAASLTRYDAAARLGWSVREFQQAAGDRGITAGRFGRYAIADVDTLANDAELDAEVRGNRLLGPDQAAAHLEVRRREIDYCIAAGWLIPSEWVASQVSRRRSVQVPLYRVTDVDALRNIPDVDWEAVRATPPGEPSPLREFARLGTRRASLVRGFAAELGQQYGIEVTATYNDPHDQWELQWAPRDGHPDRDEVHAMLRADRELAPHLRAILLLPTEESET